MLDAFLNEKEIVVVTDRTPDDVKAVFGELREAVVIREGEVFRTLVAYLPNEPNPHLGKRIPVTENLKKLVEDFLLAEDLKLLVDAFEACS